MISTRYRKLLQLDIEPWAAIMEVSALSDDSELFRLLFTTKDALLQRLKMPPKPALIAARQVFAALVFLQGLHEAERTGETLSSRPRELTTAGNSVRQVRKRTTPLRSVPSGDGHRPSGSRSRSATIAGNNLE